MKTSIRSSAPSETKLKSESVPLRKMMSEMFSVNST